MSQRLGDGLMAPLIAVQYGLIQGMSGMVKRHKRGFTYIAMITKYVL